jgi:hypothetical protein
MTKQRRVRIWAALAVSALLSFAASAGSAQDVFASNGGGSSTPVYQDSFSSGCEQTSHLVSGGYNPAYCFQLPLRSGSKCPAIGGQDSTLAGQSGNTCYYCQEAGAAVEQAVPGANWIVVPNDSGGAAYAAYQQGYQCSANPADSCYLSCYGRGSFKPPPGTTLKAGTGTGGTPQPAGSANTPPIKLQGYVSNAPDPCYPAGPKNYWVCNYPNLPRPPGCNCTQKPPAQLPQKSTQPPAKPGGQPTSQPGDYTPDPNNYHLGMMVGIANCLQSFPMLGQGMGYFMVGQFDNAAKMWGIEPGQSMLLKDLATPLTGSNVTPYQQGVIAGQRICGYSTTHFALKGLGYTWKGLTAGGDVPTLGKLKPGAGEPVARNVEPTEPTAGEPNGPTATTPPDRTVTNPPSEPAASAEPNQPAGTAEDKTLAPDKTAASNPAASPGERAPVTGGESDADPVQGDALKAELTNDQENSSNAPALGGKYVELTNGPVKLGAFKGEGSFAGVYDDGTNLVRKLAKNNGAQYYNEQIEGQANGSKALKSLGIDHPEVTEVEEGTDETPGSLVQQNTATKYPNSKELTSRDFQNAGPEMQGEILGAIKSVLDQLASKGYVMGDVNPGNFTLTVKGGKVAVVIHDPDMIMTLSELKEKMSEPGSMVPQTLNGSLAESGAGQYKVGAYANAQALESQLYSGLRQWLYNGPSTK